MVGTLMIPLGGWEWSTLLLVTPPGGWEWIVILLIVLLLFGGRKLPELTRSVGQSIKEFRKASAEDPSDEDEDDPSATRRDAES
jgi:sec-independent protein translocase protein TatA